jgi:hypothetical protein
MLPTLSQLSSILTGHRSDAVRTVTYLTEPGKRRRRNPEPAPITQSPDAVKAEATLRDLRPII